MDAATLTAQIAAINRGRKWIATVDAAAAARDLVTYLQEEGAAGVLVVAAVEGVGALPGTDVFYTGRIAGSGPTAMDGIRGFEAALRDPSDALVAAIDRFDPEGDALVLANPFSGISELAGRRVYGARPPAQAALEDKMIVDGIWDAAGVARAPSEVVPVAGAAAAAERLAGPMGTVWVADNREGWHGGANYVKWVRTAEDVTAMTAWFAAHADRVRVMPFLDGIPCSIHGWITSNGIAVLRPLEMIILRRTDGTGLFYAGMANYWDPPRRHREAMRTAARTVGEHLVERVGYRGAYGIDGVLTADGFRPTELNPRMTAGHAGPAMTAGLPAGSIMRAQLEGDMELDAEWLETTLVTAADETRSGRAIALLPEPAAPFTAEIRFTAGAAVSTDEATKEATLETGLAPGGGAVFVRFEPERTPKGPSVAPRALAGLVYARTEWNLAIPPMEPAPDLFAGES